MVEIFKTNIQQDAEANQLAALLLKHFPGSKINFDLDDCDKILKVAGKNFAAHQIIWLVNEKGFTCQILE